ncbi:acyl-CoA N-acyltransferase [Kockiozyma suomiensis]|uniref:acyl-CoA N-acyltransferase n=1 Tax=Kockiozyma suomiensis TaxID=1337062 RepID=UPI00334374D7
MAVLVQPAFLPLLPLSVDHSAGHYRARVLHVRISSFSTRDLDAARQFLNHNLQLTYSAGFLLQFITSRDSKLLIARDSDSGVIIGVVAGKLARSIADHRICHGHVMVLAVGEQYRRSGIGRILLQKLETTMRTSVTSGIKTSFLQVAHTNYGAIKFYEHQGYIIERRDKGYYQGKADALVMRKQSTPATR